MARGGRRSGAPGKAYGNRTDLNAQRAPVAIPGQNRYGAQAAQVRAQEAVPAGPTPVPTANVSAAGNTPRPAAPLTPVIPLDAPTMRPNEPLTAGVDIGAGPGAPPSPLLADVELPRRMIVALEALASLPDANEATRNLVRIFRSQM